MKLVELLGHLEQGGRVVRLDDPDVVVFIDQEAGDFKWMHLQDPYKTKRDYSINVSRLRYEGWAKWGNV
jgi:hypothetical protein